MPLMPLCHRGQETTMIDYIDHAIEAADWILSTIGMTPEIGLLTGTGLGGIVSAIATDTDVDYRNIPHFPLPTVPSHRGRMIVGTLENKVVMAMQGRFHLYEGYSTQEVTFPIRVMQQMGVRCLILSNASGGLNPAFRPGDLMIITDHINLTGANPLIGPNIEHWGVRFPDMMTAYDKQMIALAEAAAREHGVALQKGVYAGLTGPSLETPAEVRFLQTIHADAVGFSTVQEVIAAVHGRMTVLGLSTITNVHNPDDPVPATVDEIIDVAAAAAPNLVKVIRGVLKRR